MMKKTQAKKTQAKKPELKSVPMPASSGVCEALGVEETARVPDSGAVVGGTDPCTRGHSPEEHGRDSDNPGSTSCHACDDGECVAYEADPLREP